MRNLGLVALLLLLALSALLFGAVEPWASSAATGLLALLAMAATIAAWKGGLTLARDPLLLALALALTSTLLTLPTSVRRFGGLEQARLLAAALAVYLLAAALPRSPLAARRALLVLFALAIAAAAYGSLVTLSGREVVLWLRKADYRDSVTGTFINRNHFASWLGLHLYVGLGLFAAARARARLALLAPLAVGLLALGLTLSRGGLLAAAVVLPLFLYLSGAAAQRRMWLAGFALLVAGALLAATNWPRLRARIERSVDASGEPSAAARVSMWRSTLRAFAARPLLGWGAGSFASVYPSFREPGIARKVDHAHQDWLEWLAEQGALGGIAGLAALALLARGLRRTLAGAGMERPVAGGAAAGIALVLLHALVDFPLEIPALLFSTAAIAGLASALAPRRAMPLARPALLALLGLFALTALRSGQVWMATRALDRGDLAFARVAWDRAGEEFARAVRIDPSNPAAWYALGRSEVNRGKFRGREGLAALGKLRQDALDHLRQAERRDRMNPDYKLDQAWLLNFLGRKDEAAAKYDEAVARDPFNANTLFFAAAFHLHRRETARGLELLGRAVHSWPNFFGGKIHEIDYLVPDAARVLAILPVEQPFLGYQYATYLLDRGRLEPAREALLWAVRKGGWRGDWIVPFAGQIAARESRAAALALYDRVPPSFRTALTENEVVRLLLAEGRGAEARGRLREAQTRFPDSRELTVLLVRQLGSSGESESALGRYRAERGEDAGFWAIRGFLSLEDRAPLVALGAFERALGFEPPDPEAALGASLALQAAARRAEADGACELAEEARAAARTYTYR